MKRLFFQLVLSVMISACHDANQEANTTEVATTGQQEISCSTNGISNDLHQLGNIAQSCPVK